MKDTDERHFNFISFFYASFRLKSYFVKYMEPNERKRKANSFYVVDAAVIWEI